VGAVADRLSTEIKESLKAGDRTRLATMRLLAAAVKNREVELGHDLSEEEFLEVVGREVKRRREAAEAYERALSLTTQEPEQRFLARRLSEMRRPG